MRQTLLTAGGIAALALCASALAAPTFKFSDADAEVIVGEVQKPDVTVIVSRENLNKSYDFTLEESFIDRIVKAVERAPF